jgi:hypothetical protein
LVGRSYLKNGEKRKEVSAGVLEEPYSVAKARAVVFPGDVHESTHALA